jgi:hypothetical protein
MNAKYFSSHAAAEEATPNGDFFVLKNDFKV